MPQGLLPLTRPEAHRRLAIHLAGEGVELGPGHNPFPLPFPGTSVRYVDRWEPEENRVLFPELGEAAPFPKPHIVANLDVDRLSALGDGSQDFVIASHVLEHMADPIGQVREIHRVLRTGGTTLVLLPDRRLTFDQHRQPTPVDHLVAENEAGVQRVDDAHIEDFIRGTGDWDDAWSQEDARRQMEVHRQRSIHVHCWSQDEFLPVLQHLARTGAAFELVDALWVEDVVDSFEFGYVLRKAAATLDGGIAAARLESVLHTLRATSFQARPAELEPPSPTAAAKAVLGPLVERARAAVARRRT